MSKGSKPRPYSISQAEFAKNFDRIFKKNNPTLQEIEDNMVQCELLDDVGDINIEYKTIEEPTYSKKD